MLFCNSFERNDLAQLDELHTGSMHEKKPQLTEQKER